LLEVLGTGLFSGLVIGLVFDLLRELLLELFSGLILGLRSGGDFVVLQKAAHRVVILRLLRSGFARIMVWQE